MRQEKTELRGKILSLRDDLTPQDRIEFSLRACDHAANIAPLKKACAGNEMCAGFFPIKSEIDPRPLMSQLSSLGAGLCLPVVVDKTKIEFRVLHKDAPLQDAGFGTQGPCAESEIVNPSVLLVPLSVYDRGGGRMGYGKGYYDKAIQDLRTREIDPLLIGMAFSLQETTKVPMEAHDCTLHFIATQDGIITAGRK